MPGLRKRHHRPLSGKPHSGDGEAVEQTRTSGTDEVLRCATRRAVGGVPGRARRCEGITVCVAYPGVPLGVARPVAAGLVLARGIRRAIHL